MLKWLRGLFVKESEPNPYIGMFDGWTQDNFRVESPNKEFVFWTANGFSAFRDDTIKVPKTKFLDRLSRSERKLVWDALQMESAGLDRAKALQMLERIKMYNVGR
jgi:hypothetical protein